MIILQDIDSGENDFFVPAFLFFLDFFNNFLAWFGFGFAAHIFNQAVRAHKIAPVLDPDKSARGRPGHGRGCGRMDFYKKSHGLVRGFKIIFNLRNFVYKTARSNNCAAVFLRRPEHLPGPLFRAVGYGAGVNHAIISLFAKGNNVPAEFGKTGANFSIVSLVGFTAQGIKTNAHNLKLGQFFHGEIS